MTERIFAAILALMLIFACACAEEETAAEPNYITEADLVETVEYKTVEYVSEAGGYKLNVPEGWEEVEGLDITVPEDADIGRLKSFGAFVSPDGSMSLSVVTADSGSAGIEDISDKADALTSEVIGRMKNVTLSDKNGYVTSGDKVYMYIGYIIDGETTVDQYYYVLGEDMILITFVNSSDNGLKGAVLGTLAPAA